MKNEIEGLKIKRGYLNTDFEYFHLKDKLKHEFDSHYHDFNKIIIFLSGDVTYLIEGKFYKLKPWDILLVNRDDVHKPLINGDIPYERIIIWVNSSFLELHYRDNCSLLSCFELSSKEKISLLRLEAESTKGVQSLLNKLETAVYDTDFGAVVLKNSIFLQLLVYINRFFINRQSRISSSDIEYDSRISSILEYINSKLEEDLSVDNISAQFFMNKYFLMHKFKAETGYTLHSYIQQKRLIKASNLLMEGMPVTEVYLKCGFNDYSNFMRAFKGSYGLSPKNYYKTIKELKKNYITDKTLI